MLHLGFVEIVTKSRHGLRQMTRCRLELGPIDVQFF